MALVPPSPRWRRTAGGHGLLEAVPRIYQVTPDIPDRRRATQQDESQTADLADSLKESQLAAGREPPFSVGRHRHRESQQQASTQQSGRPIRRCSVSSKALARHLGRSALSARRKTRASPEVNYV